jgi:acid phosphatase (class A)
MKLELDWRDQLKAVAIATWENCSLEDAKKKVTPIRWDPSKLESALADIVDAAGEREDRFAECFHQQDAEGCISYWIGMLGIDPASKPNTYQLIRVARKIGEMVVMCLKAHFDIPRPSQICPAIVPMFDPPRTASYPAGHSLQSYLISYLLIRVMPGIPQSSPSPAPDSWDDPNRKHEGLFALARRVADNRVIAGVHYDIDSKAGFLVARAMDQWFEKVLTEPTKFPELKALLEAAKEEFPQYQLTPE